MLDRQAGWADMGADRVQHAVWVDRQPHELPQGVRGGATHLRDVLEPHGGHWGPLGMVLAGALARLGSQAQLLALAHLHDGVALHSAVVHMLHSPDVTGPPSEWFSLGAAQQYMCCTALLGQPWGTSALLVAVAAGCVLCPSRTPWGQQRRLPLTVPCQPLREVSYTTGCRPACTGPLKYGAACTHLTHEATQSAGARGTASRLHAFIGVWRPQATSTYAQPAHISTSC